MATINKAAMKWVLNFAGTSPDTLELAEGASQSFVKGEFVYMLAGYVTEIGSNTPALIYGMAAADGSNTTAGAAQVPVYIAHEPLLFEGNVLDTGAADYVLTQADLGTPMAIQRDTSANITYLDASIKAGTSCRVFVHKVATGSAVGDTNARVQFSIIPKYSQSITSS